MIVCPDCGCFLPFLEIPECNECGWEAKRIGDVVSLLSSDIRQDSLTNAYTKLYDEICADDLERQLVDKNYHSAEAIRLAGYAGNITGLDVADIGCGRGVLLNALSSKSSAKSLIGIDISLKYLERVARIKGVQTFQANAEKLPFRNVFDVIFSSDVMEHVLNLGSFLVSINWALRLNGLFVVRVPYQENMLQYADQLGAKYPVVHLRAYNKKLLIDDLKRSGFKIEKIYLDGQFFARPRRIWTRKYCWVFYNWINIKTKILRKSDGSQKNLNNFYRKIFLDPVTIVAICRKKSEIKKI